MRDERYTVGLFVADINDDFSRGICKGTIDTAYDADMNLVIIPGNYIDRDLDIYEGSIQYEYQHNVLFDYVSPDTIDLLIIVMGSIGYLSTQERRKEFLDRFRDIPLVTVASNVEGYEYVMYDNAAGVRESVEYLIKHGRRRIACLAGFMDNEEATVRFETYRDALRANGIEPEDRMVECCNMTRMCEDSVANLFERNPDIDAVVCVNDESACAVYAYLESHGKTVGKDVAVVGFDDLSYSNKMNPPLATVRANPIELGIQALKEGIRLIQTGGPVNHYVATQFINRASAGFEDANNEESVTALDFDVEKMLSDYRTTNRVAKEMFTFSKYADQNYVMLLNRLSMLGILNCYLYLLENPVIHLQSDEWIMPESLMMKACMLNGIVMPIPKYRQKMPVACMYDHQYLPRKRYTMMLIDLFSNEIQYGVVMMDFHFDKHYCMEALGYQMSAAVRMLQLMQTQEEAQRKLEENLEQLEENNINLNMEAISDRLTSLFNRRGFEQKANEVLSDESNNGKYVFVAYADMDNLKIINDRFGHKEGDFALRACADMLKNIFSPNDIIGRIGGDEFAIFSLGDKSVNMKELREKAGECMAKFNQDSDKPYNVRLTIGGYTQRFLQECRLGDMLENADSDLYEAKKQKDKDVIKS